MGKDNQQKKIPTEIIVAIIGLIGITITAYFTYLQMIVPQRDALHATQTAEQRASNAAETQTARADGATRTGTPTHIVTATLIETTDVPATPPTPTSTRTPRMGPGLQFCANAFSINVRSGPGTNYPVIGGLTSADCLFFDASNEDKTWLRVASQAEPYADLAGGWVYGELLGLPGFVNLPAITLTPTPTPTEPPTGTPTPQG